jgi:hypothetical protein
MLDTHGYNGESFEKITNYRYKVTFPVNLDVPGIPQTTNFDKNVVKFIVEAGPARF